MKVSKVPSGLTGGRSSAQKDASQHSSPISILAINGGAIVSIKAVTTAKYCILTRETKYVVTMLAAIPDITWARKRMELCITKTPLTC
jgi:hypothetical protein